MRKVSEVHLNGEAGRVPAAAAGAVSARLEDGCAGALRGQHHVVVYPLTPVHQQVGQSGVHRDFIVVSKQHFL